MAKMIEVTEDSPKGHQYDKKIQVDASKMLLPSLDTRSEDEDIIEITVDSTKINIRESSLVDLNEKMQ